jgi:outer membrane immunogenic protein
MTTGGLDAKLSVTKTQQHDEKCIGLRKNLRIVVFGKLPRVLAQVVRAATFNFETRNRVRCAAGRRALGCSIVAGGQGQPMKKKIVSLASVGFAVLAVAGSVQAADLKAAAAYANPPPITESSWTGFYAGLGVGLRTSRTDLTTISATRGGGALNLSGIATNQLFDTTSFRTSPYAGFNWQFAPRWIVGIESEYGFGSRTATLGGFSFSPGVSNFVSTNASADSLAVETTWDASLRGRLGFLIKPTLLAYATGGASWQHDEVASTCASATCVGLNIGPAVFINSTTKTGWTLGGGLEVALWHNWLARAEYRYSNFGSAPYTMTRTSVNGVIVDNFDVNLRTYTATFGLAYKFGDPIVPRDFGDEPSAPRPGAAPHATWWTGLYAGFGLGARALRTDLTTTSVTVDGTRVDLTNSATHQPFDGTTFRANPYVGFDWQFAPQWVAGIEGDFGFAERTITRAGFAFSPGLFVVDSQSDHLTVKPTWDAGLRGRLGFLVNPATMLYASSGVAWQHYDVTSICAGPFCTVLNFLPAIITSSNTKTGWSLGGGIETAVWGNWLARGEYRYADFGATPMTVARTSALGSIVDTFDVKMRTHTVTFGLAYKFN